MSKFLRNFIFVIIILACFVAFCFSDVISDAFGYRFIAGYHSSYIYELNIDLEDIDRPDNDRIITTSSPLGKFVFDIFELLYFVFLVCIVVISYKLLYPCDVSKSLYCGNCRKESTSDCFQPIIEIPPRQPAESTICKGYLSDMLMEEIALIDQENVQRRAALAAQKRAQRVADSKRLENNM